ncbi:PAS domain S-box protein [Foetidibacter luteolus]|uniref:PAS domain S-box protein n=1 Tax=Foetidibacter luteolus TaxID=2608880 RepID=UPI00129B080A|nr:PAS domain S-box protein [Foetidibacter luteolus]
MATPVNYPHEQMMAAIIDSSEDAIISKNLDSRITSWNRAAERMFGYTEQEMIGRQIHILIPDDRKSEEERIIEQLKRGERVEHFETVRVTKDGKQLQISLTISPIRGADGKIIGASKIARDITQQKLNEERLAIINDLAQSINRKLDTEAILQLVTDGTTRLSGAAFGAFFYNKVDVNGQAFMLYALSGAPREAFDRFGMPRNTTLFSPTFDGTGAVRSDDITKDPRYGHNYPHKGMPAGHLPVISYLAVPVISQDNHVIGGLFFGHPKTACFTEEHEKLVVAIAAQAAIALDNARLLQEVQFLNRKKDQFIGFASHELRTPLTTVKGYLQLLSAGIISVDDALKRVTPQVDRLEAIIADLLDISRIQAGKLALAPEKISLQNLIKESAELVDLSSHNFQLENAKHDTLVYVDRQKFSQVLVNLLSNAAKYTPAGKLIKVSWSIVGENAHIVVEDEGIGIEQKYLEDIFSQFYRVSSSENQGKGIGLGLFIAKEIVEAHFGQIWAESEPGKGSLFHVTFPVNRMVTG